MHNINPKYYTIVMLKNRTDKGGDPRPVVIIDGQLEVDGRLSNFWSWRPIRSDLTLGFKESGYGFFDKYEGPLKAVATLEDGKLTKLSVAFKKQRKAAMEKSYV